MARGVPLLGALVLAAACAGQEARLGQGDAGAGPVDAAGAAEAPAEDLAVGVDLGGAENLDAEAEGDSAGPDAAHDLDVGEVGPDESDPAGDEALLAARPYNFQVPPGYDPAVPAPLLVLLHGYGATAVLQSMYLGLGRFAASHGLLYAYPDGSPDPGGFLFWDATDACCNFFRPPVDDVRYVRAILDDVERRYNVDRRRIFLFGHSNGGFLAHRLACDLSDRVAAIACLAGATWQDGARCTPAHPVAVLQVHGTLDAVIAYGGGAAFPGRPVHPGARGTVSRWADIHGCRPAPMDVARYDLDAVLPFAETRVERYVGCERGEVELWTIENGSHLPLFRPEFLERAYQFMMAHPKP